jgi:hypothetical protein
VHRVKNLFEQVCSMRNLRLAAKEALRGKRSRPPGAMFFMELEKELPALHEELCDGTYTHGGYHYFWIHDPKDRLVAAAPFRDRVTVTKKRAGQPCHGPAYCLVTPYGVWRVPECPLGPGPGHRGVGNRGESSGERSMDSVGGQSSLVKSLPAVSVIHFDHVAEGHAKTRSSTRWQRSVAVRPDAGPKPCR